MTDRLCIDCIFKSGSYCTRQWREEPKINPVDGRKISGYHWQCSTQRIFTTDCGPRGRWWRPIKPQNDRSQLNATGEPSKPNRPNIIKRAALRVLRLLG